MSTGISLKMSDLVSGGLCAAYSSFIDKKTNVLTPGLEQVAYRVIGRFAADKISVTDGLNMVLTENDFMAGGVAFADHMVRKGDNASESAYALVRSGVSSWAATKLLAVAKINDSVLFGV